MNLTLSLADLDPHWIDEPNLGRRGMGVNFRCPANHINKHNDFNHRYYCYFENPLDGGARSVQHPALIKTRQVWWHRTGDTFETLSMDKTVNVRACGGRLLLQNGLFSVYEPFVPKRTIFVPQPGLLVARPAPPEPKTIIQP